METIQKQVQQQVQMLKQASNQPTQMQQRRRELKELSDSLKDRQLLAQKQGKVVPTINELLQSVYEEQLGIYNQVFKTFDEWKELGNRVKKGAKAFLFWGSYKLLRDKNGNIVEREDGRPIEYHEVLFKFAEIQTYNVYNCM